MRDDSRAEMFNFMEIFYNPILAHSDAWGKFSNFFEKISRLQDANNFWEFHLAIGRLYEKSSLVYIRLNNSIKVIKFNSCSQYVRSD